MTQILINYRAFSYNKHKYLGDFSRKRVKICHRWRSNFWYSRLWKKGYWATGEGLFK